MRSSTSARNSFKMSGNDSCPCQSGLKLKKCCGNGSISPFKQSWVGPKDPQTGYSNPACYLSSFSDCDDKSSREHLISKNILVEAGEGTYSGFPFLNGMSKSLPPDAIASHVLCKRHNEMLSGLDVAGGSVFKAIKQGALGEISGHQRLLVSGHDFERWMLQRLCAMHAAGQTANAGISLKDFAFDFALAGEAILYNRWPKGAGLWLGIPRPEQHFDKLQFAPVTHSTYKMITGCQIGFFGLVFYLDFLGFGVDGVGVTTYRPLELLMQDDFETAIRFSYSDNNLEKRGFILKRDKVRRNVSGTK